MASRLILEIMEYLIKVALTKQGVLLFFFNKKIIVPFNPKRGIWNGFWFVTKQKLLKRALASLLEDCLACHCNAATQAE